MKGLFIPEITAEMFRNGCLESIEALMAEGEIYDIDYPLEREPCEDCISRTELLSRIDAERKYLLNLKMDGAEHIIVHHARRIIEDMPPVTPQPKVGKWLEKEIHGNNVGEWQSAKCSVCDKYHTTPYMYYFSHYKFCPNCGCRMRGKEAEG